MKKALLFLVGVVTGVIGILVYELFGTPTKYGSYQEYLACIKGPFVIEADDDGWELGCQMPDDFGYSLHRPTTEQEGLIDAYKNGEISEKATVKIDDTQPIRTNIFGEYGQEDIKVDYE